MATTRSEAEINRLLATAAAEYADEERAAAAEETQTSQTTLLSSRETEPMSARSNLHRLVDELDEQQIPDATALLSTLQPGDVPRQPRRPRSLIGAYDSGRTDVATRSAEIIRDELGRRDPHCS